MERGCAGGECERGGWYRRAIIGYGQCPVTRDMKLTGLAADRARLRLNLQTAVTVAVMRKTVLMHMQGRRIAGNQQ